MFFSFAAFADVNRFTKVKAVFLFKFLSYVTWPSGHAPEKDRRSYVCTLGKNNLDALLKKIGGRKEINAKVKNSSKNEVLKKCHIIYMRTSNQAMFFKGFPVLTVSEQPGFARTGGMIEILEKQKKVKIVINLKVVEAAGMTVSSRLLSIAEVLR